MTLGEVSQEIHHLKKEIIELKAKISRMEKEKSQEPMVNPNVDIFEGIHDSSMGFGNMKFGNMKIMTIQYQHHHVLLDINIQGEIFTLKTLIYSGADINVLNKNLILAKYWTYAHRQVNGVGL